MTADFVYISVKSKVSYQVAGIACDKKLLISGNDPDLDLAVGSGDLLQLASQTVVNGIVEFDAEVLHGVAYIGASVVGVLTDAAGENNSVKSVHDSSIGADELLDLIAEHLAGKLRLVVAVLRRACDIAVIAGDTGNSEEAGLLVHVVAHLVGSKTQLICNEGYSGGVYAAAACSHDNAVQRSEAHGSVNGLAALDGGDGGAVAEVAGYDLEILDILAHSVSESLAYKSVRCAVEAVLSYVQLLVALVGKAVHERLLRHGGMERGIEYDYLRSRSRNYLLACSQGERVGVVMYRCELCEVVYLLDNFVCNEGGLAEDLSALYYSVAYGGDLTHAVDDLALAGGEYLNELLERLGVGRELAVSLDCPAVERGVLDMAVDTDTVAVALCNNALVLHIDKLVLQRGAAGIDYKNLHVNKSFQVK